MSLDTTNQSAQTAQKIAQPAKMAPLLHGEIVVRTAEAVGVHMINGVPNAPEPSLAGPCDVTLTNFRILFGPPRPEWADAHLVGDTASVGVPLLLIETLVIKRPGTVLELTTKDMRRLRVEFQTDFNVGDEGSLYEALRNFAFPSALSRLFAFDFHPELALDSLQTPDQSFTFNIESEFRRFGLDAQSAWRVTACNKDFGVCLTYPRQWITPALVSDELLTKASNGRVAGRLPMLSWRSRATGAVLLRSSCPLTNFPVNSALYLANKDLTQATLKATVNGTVTARNNEASAAATNDTGDDMYTETLVHNRFGSIRSIRNVLPSSLNTPGKKKHRRKPRDPASKLVKSISLQSLEAASNGSAETPEFGGMFSLFTGQKYEAQYPEFNFEMTSLGLSSDGSIALSYRKLKDACLVPEELSDKWLSTLQQTGWFDLLKEFLTTAGTVADRVTTHNSSFVLLEDTTPDRVCIVSSLVQLILDPFYRTLRGFCHLVQKEWISVGFPFAGNSDYKRGQSIAAGEGPRDRSTFLLFLDTVYQLLCVNPCAFEFTCDLLSFVADHSQAGLFGTFIGSCEKERALLHASEKTTSIWPYLEMMLKTHPDEPLLNPLYADSTSVVVPTKHYQLRFWEEHYLRPSVLSTQRLAIWARNHKLVQEANKQHVQLA